MPVTRRQVNIVVPPTKPATHGKNTGTKGKAVAKRASRPRARKTRRIESPLPDTVDEVLPIAGPSAMPRRPLFEETPAPMDLDVERPPVDGPMSSGESRCRIGVVGC